MEKEKRIMTKTITIVALMLFVANLLFLAANITKAKNIPVCIEPVQQVTYIIKVQTDSDGNVELENK